MEMDLNIDNYSLEDMLKLFNMPRDYDEHDLKTAMKILSKLHPDKSNLDKDIFIFFHKVYKILLNFYKIKKRDMFREDFYDESEGELLKEFSKKKNFNKIFNKLFDSVKIKKNDGYGNWLKNSEIIQTEKTNNVNEYFNKKHNEIVLTCDLKELHIKQGTPLIENEDTVYSSDIFSNLKYDDVKDVYSKTHIPVSNNIGDRIMNVEELKRSRKIVDDPYSKEESLKILNNKSKKENNENMNQIFNMFKSDEQHKKNKNKWWTNFKKLTI